MTSRQSWQASSVSALRPLPARGFRRPPATVASPLNTLFPTILFLLSLSQRLRILDESRGLGYDPLVCSDSRSSLAPTRPPHLHHCATRLFTHSSFTHLLHFLFVGGLGH